MNNTGDNVFSHIPAAAGEGDYFTSFLDSQDFARATRRAVATDIRKFAQWFTQNNCEPFRAARVTVRDVTDFRSFLREEKRQAVATVNRCLVSLRRFFGWLTDEGHLPLNPAKKVKELNIVTLAPKGLEKAQVRKLLREVELRNDVRGSAICHLLLYTGCRVGDVANLELQDLLISERTGTVVFRNGKGGKQRSSPIPLPARKAISAYLDTRTFSASQKVFIGERGPLTERGIRALCEKYSVVCGFRIYPHLLRHTFAHQFLADNENDLVGLAQLLGHQNIQTTSRYCQRSADALAEATDRMSY